MKNNSNYENSIVVSVRLPRQLYSSLKEYARNRGFLNESEAIRSILRERLSEGVIHEEGS